MEQLIHQAEFRLPGFSLRVHCSVQGILSELREVYPASVDLTSYPVDSTYRILARTDSVEEGQVYTLEENGTVTFRTPKWRSVVHYLSSRINRAVSERAEGCLTFHAGAVSFKNIGIMLPAESRSGKSTLTLALLLRGCQYLSDEIAILDQTLDQRRLHLIPFRKSLWVRSGSFSLFPQFEEYFSARSNGNKRHPNKRSAFLPPRMVREDCFSEPCPLGLIVFSAFNPGHGTRFQPIPRSQAVLKLLRSCFNLGHGRSESIDPVIAAVRQADCFTLTYDDMEKAGEHILHAAGETPQSGEPGLRLHNSLSSAKVPN